MDLMIPIGQKNTLAEYMILSGADNRPPMLDKDLYDSWKSIMELYMQNREHGRMILESVEHGPLIWPTIEEHGVTRTKKYAELSATEKIQDYYDLKATNIILQEQERECKLYDAFDKFAHIKGEPLHQYYLRFTQLFNDMNIYKIKLEQFQVNTKFLNSLPPEWSKFVTDVKLVKDLHTTNFNQLHAYLQQHELHANDIRIMRERIHDPLALVANHQQTPSHFNTYQSSTIHKSNNRNGEGNNSGQQRDCKVFLTARGRSYGKTVPKQRLKMLQDPKVVEGLVTQTVITHNATYQADDLDAYDSNYDDFSTAKAVLMANLSSYGSDVLSKVSISNNTNNDMLNQSVQEIPYSEQTHLVNYLENEITSDSNIIPYSQYLLETQNAAV
ncbi:hypothetical protein Tco_0427758 [Tanacetum coccineum]